MLKDTILFGGTAGVIGNIGKEVITWVFYYLGLTRYTFEHFCAGIYVSPAHLNEPAAFLLGFLTDFTFAAIFGITILIIIKKTGTDFWIIKGLVFGIGIYVLCYGILRPLISSKVIIQAPLTNLLFIIPNLLFGLIVSWFIHRFGRFQR